MRQLKISKSITNRSSEALDKYLVEIGREPMVSIDEEIELAQKIRKGGREGERAKEKLVKANLRFVVSVAKQYQHQGLSLTDLIDEGNIGLVKAAEKFDETRAHAVKGVGLHLRVGGVAPGHIPYLTEYAQKIRLELHVARGVRARVGMVIELQAVVIAHGLDAGRQELAGRGGGLKHDAVGHVARPLQDVRCGCRVKQPFGDVGGSGLVGDVIFVGRGVVAYGDREKLLDRLTVVVESTARQEIGRAHV